MQLDMTRERRISDAFVGAQNWISVPQLSNSSMIAGQMIDLPPTAELVMWQGSPANQCGPFSGRSSFLIKNFTENTCRHSKKPIRFSGLILHGLPRFAGAISRCILLSRDLPGFLAASIAATKVYKPSSLWRQDILLAHLQHPYGQP